MSSLFAHLQDQCSLGSKPLPAYECAVTHSSSWQLPQAAKLPESSAADKEPCSKDQFKTAAVSYSPGSQVSCISGAGQTGREAQGEQACFAHTSSRLTLIADRDQELGQYAPPTCLSTAPAPAASRLPWPGSTTLQSAPHPLASLGQNGCPLGDWQEEHDDGRLKLEPRRAVQPPHILQHLPAAWPSAQRACSCKCHAWHQVRPQRDLVPTAPVVSMLATASNANIGSCTQLPQLQARLAAETGWNVASGLCSLHPLPSPQHLGHPPAAPRHCASHSACAQFQLPQQMRQHSVVQGNRGYYSSGPVEQPPLPGLCRAHQQQTECVLNKYHSRPANDADGLGLVHAQNIAMDPLAKAAELRDQLRFNSLSPLPSLPPPFQLQPIQQACGLASSAHAASASAPEVRARARVSSL